MNEKNGGKICQQQKIKYKILTSKPKTTTKHSKRTIGEKNENILQRCRLVTFRTVIFLEEMFKRGRESGRGWGKEREREKRGEKRERKIKMKYE